MKIIAIGDTHDAPDVDKQRFRWFGKYIRKVKPDAVVQIGDFITLDSCTHYIPFILFTNSKVFSLTHIVKTWIFIFISP